MRQRGDPLTTVFRKDGTLADTVEDIEEALLLHNEDILKRREHPEEYREIHNMKKQLQQTLMGEQMKTFKSLSFEDYMAVVNKVMTKKKAMFQEFRDTSPRFKIMIYHLLKYIYESEDFPEEFSV